MKDELKGVRDIDKSREIINDNLKYIKTLQKMKLKTRKNYAVNVSLGDYPFQLKYIAILVFQLSLSSTESFYWRGCWTNWWCVLFPPLCF